MGYPFRGKGVRTHTHTHTHTHIGLAAGITRLAPNIDDAHDHQAA